MFYLLYDSTRESTQKRLESQSLPLSTLVGYACSHHSLRRCNNFPMAVSYHERLQSPMTLGTMARRGRDSVVVRNVRMRAVGLLPREKPLAFIMRTSGDEYCSVRERRKPRMVTGLSWMTAAGWAIDL
jgi:hypothetical protein